MKTWLNPSGLYSTTYTSNLPRPTPASKTPQGHGSILTRAQISKVARGLSLNTLWKHNAGTPASIQKFEPPTNAPTPLESQVQIPAFTQNQHSPSEQMKAAASNEALVDAALDLVEKLEELNFSKDDSYNIILSIKDLPNAIAVLDALKGTMGYFKEDMPQKRWPHFPTSILAYCICKIAKSKDLHIKPLLRNLYFLFLHQKSHNPFSNDRSFQNAVEKIMWVVDIIQHIKDLAEGQVEQLSQRLISWLQDDQAIDALQKLKESTMSLNREDRKTIFTDIFMEDVFWNGYIGDQTPALLAWLEV